MSDLLTQIENVNATRKAAAEEAYNAALAKAEVDPDTIAYLESLEHAAADRPATPADVVRLEGVLSRLGRTLEDFRHDVQVRQRVAKLRASILTDEQRAALWAQRQAAQDECERRLRKLGHDMIDRLPAEGLNVSIGTANLALGGLLGGRFDGNVIGQSLAPIMIDRDGGVRLAEGKLALSREHATEADDLERSNPRAFPPAE